MDLKEVECEDVNWIHLSWDKDRHRALVNTVLNLLVSLMAGNFLIT
jgi:hypothetical protein